MKKFSNISGYKVGEVPTEKVEEISESDQFIGKIQFLMDQFLTIQTYGPLDRYQRAGDIKIKGKELFLEALLGLLESVKGKEVKALLEGLRKETGDWEMIDNNIDRLNLTEYDVEKESKIIKYKKSIKGFLENYDDSELTINLVKDSISKIKTIETAELKYQSSLSLKESGEYDSELIDTIVGLYETAYTELKNKQI